MNNNIEEFRLIPDFDRYEVSNFGNVKAKARTFKDSMNRNRTSKVKLLKPRLDKDGYPTVVLTNIIGSFNKPIHKLIQATFTDKFNQGLPCIDHIDRDKTNNHIDNLRECTTQENMRNRPKYKGKHTSKYKGVHWSKTNKQWTSRILIDKKRIFLGGFKNEDDAGRAYDKKAKEVFGEFAYLNFPI